MLQKPENEINLDDPFVILFRKEKLSKLAKEQGSDLFCPDCRTNLPYTPMTVATVPDGVDANFEPVGRIAYFCTICQKYFDKS